MRRLAPSHEDEPGGQGRREVQQVAIPSAIKGLTVYRIATRGGEDDSGSSNLEDEVGHNLPGRTLEWAICLCFTVC